MDTQILPVDGQSLKYAKEIIESGGVVAFPTETVYGLGANAFDDKAVASIFEIKGRPNDNPLIVHVSENYDIGALVERIPGYARALAESFLPGPLTMVYESRDKVAKSVSCGLETLAIRVPSHAGAQSFLTAVGLPVAAPSANISKHVSPVSARHVYDDLKGKIPLILDGGHCQGGIESTVLDCTGEKPCILRSGLVTREMIMGVAGECGEYEFKDGERARSPGMKYKHYSPKCRTVLYEFKDRACAYMEYAEKRADGVNAYFMCDDSVARQFKPEFLLNLGANENEIARNLYGKLREGENLAELIIAVAPEKQDGVMAGVMNRMRKAFG